MVNMINIIYEYFTNTHVQKAGRFLWTQSLKQGLEHSRCLRVFVDLNKFLLEGSRSLRPGREEEDQDPTWSQFHGLF